MAGDGYIPNEKEYDGSAERQPAEQHHFSTLSRACALTISMARKQSIIMLALLAAFAAPSCRAPDGLLKVDDSYTVSQRFAAHRDEFPEITWPTVETLAGQSIQFDVPYKEAPGRTLHIDVFSPPDALRNKMAVVLVHGGGWRSGNKSHFYPLANLLAQRGYVVFVPEFRLSVEATYPAGVVDIFDAISWADGNSSIYGFDRGRIAVGGGSSGGQMAALIAYTHQTSLFRPIEKSQPPLLALIDLDGVLDFTTPLALEFEDRMKDKSAAGIWLGGAFERNRARWIEASPASHVDGLSPPTLIISSGLERFTAGREDVLSTLSALGIRNQYIEHEQVLHTFWLFEPYVSETAEDIHTFLKLVDSDRTPRLPGSSKGARENSAGAEQ